MDNLDLLAVPELRERFLEAAFSDVAPRADDVRPDIDTHASIVAQREYPLARGLLIHGHPIRGWFLP